MKRFMMVLIFSVVLFPLFPQPGGMKDNIGVSLQYEKGFLKAFLHTIRIGETGTEFDYIRQGGQEILFPFERFRADLTFLKHNRISFLYQPLNLETSTRFYDSVKIDDVTFPADTVVDMKYGFPFYRLTYSYQFLLSPKQEIGAGLALQLRDASITFTSADGQLITSSQNVGPVPAIHVNYRLAFSPALYLYFEATGLYASSAIINGASFEFEGSILDSSLRLGAGLQRDAGAFINLRFLGGSAKGTSEYSNDRWSESRERFTSNYLALGTLSLGFEMRL